MGRPHEHGNLAYEGDGIMQGTNMYEPELDEIGEEEEDGGWDEDECEAVRDDEGIPICLEEYDAEAFGDEIEEDDFDEEEEGEEGDAWDEADQD